VFLVSRKFNSFQFHAYSQDDDSSNARFYKLRITTSSSRACVCGHISTWWLCNETHFSISPKALPLGCPSLLCIMLLILSFIIVICLHFSGTSFVSFKVLKHHKQLFRISLWGVIPLSDGRPSWMWKHVCHKGSYCAFYVCAFYQFI